MAIDRSTIWPYRDGEPDRFYYSRYDHPTAAEAEAALAGRPPSDELFAHAAGLAAAATAPVSDQRGSAAYKRHVAGVLTERVLARAAARALAGPEGAAVTSTDTGGVT